MNTITIKKPNTLKTTDEKIISSLLSSILGEYNDFDIMLMQKYYETKDLNESNFINI